MCAEKSILWTTGALGDGTNPYTQAEAISWQYRTFGDGIHKNYLNELKPTGAAPNVQVDTGSALVSGFPYLNDAAVNVNIPTPIVDTRIDRIVLRASWAAATVRITRIAGVEGGAAPAIVQTLGVTWDVPICQAEITTGAVITVTDERAWMKARFHAAEMVATLKRILTTLGGTDGHASILPGDHGGRAD